MGPIAMSRVVLMPGKIMTTNVKGVEVISNLNVKVKNVVVNPVRRHITHEDI